MRSLDCLLVRRRLSRYLDDELPARQTCRVERHLAGCPGCQRVLDDLVDGVRFVAGQRTPEPPQEAWQGIEHRLTMSGIRGFAEGEAVIWRPSAARAVGRRRLALAAVVVLLIAAAVPVAGRLLAPRAALAHEIDLSSLLTDLRADRFQQGGFWQVYRVKRVPSQQAARACPSGYPPAAEVPRGFWLAGSMIFQTDCCEGLLLVYKREETAITVVQIPDHHPMDWGPETHEPRRLGADTLDVHQDPVLGGVVVTGSPVNLLVAGRTDLEELGAVASYLHTRAEGAVSAYRD